MKVDNSLTSERLVLLVNQFCREDLETGRDWAMEESEGSELRSLCLLRHAATSFVNLM